MVTLRYRARWSIHNGKGWNRSSNTLIACPKINAQRRWRCACSTHNRMIQLQSGLRLLPHWLLSYELLMDVLGQDIIKKIVLYMSSHPSESKLQV